MSIKIATSIMILALASWGCNNSDFSSSSASSEARSVKNASSDDVSIAPKPEKKKKVETITVEGQSFMGQKSEITLPPGFDYSSYEVSEAPNKGQIISIDPETGILTYIGNKSDDEVVNETFTIVTETDDTIVEVVVELEVKNPDPKEEPETDTETDLYTYEEEEIQAEVKIRQSVTLDLPESLNYENAELVKLPLKGTIEELDFDTKKITYKPTTGAGQDDTIQFRDKRDDVITTLTVRFTILGEDAPKPLDERTLNADVFVGQSTLINLPSGIDYGLSKITVQPSIGQIDEVVDGKMKFTASSGAGEADMIVIEEEQESKFVKLTINISIHSPAPNEKFTTIDEDVYLNANTSITLPDASSYDGVQRKTEPSYGSILSIDSVSKVLKYKATSGIGKIDSIKLENFSDNIIHYININLNIVNRAPKADAKSSSSTKNNQINLTLSGSDPDGQAISFKLPGKPTGVSSWSFDQGSKRLKITPVNDWTGTISFSYKVNDGIVDSPNANVSITVNNSSVTGGNISASTMMNQRVELHLKGSDADNDSLSFSASIPASSGKIISLNSGTGKMVYEPPHNYSGSISFKYTVSDGSSSTQGTVNMNITNNAPTLSKSTREVHLLVGESETFQLSDLGSDKDGHELIYKQVSLSKGSVSYSQANKSFTYKADGSFVGTATLKYKLSDGNKDSATGTINFIICRTSEKMGIWSDLNEDKSKANEIFLGEIKNYTNTGETAETNYGYGDSSAHLTVGPQLNDRLSNVFFVRNKEGLNFYMVHNKHEGEEEQNSVKWEITVKGNEKQDRLLVTDDRRVQEATGKTELHLKSESSNQKVYLGDWVYNMRTDGGVIGPINNPAVDISVKYLTNGNLADISFHSSDGKTINLNKDNLRSNAFIISTQVINTVCK